MFVACDLAHWQVNEYFCHGGLGVDWRLPHTTIRLGNSQASVVNTVHSYTQQLAQKNKLSLGIGGFTERGLALSVDRKVTCSFFKKHGFPM